MTRLVILDVGHGNCAVVYDAAGCVVVDAGPGTALLEFMREQQIEIVEEMLISHADTDHLKGALTLLDQADITVRSVRLNSDAAKDSQQWDAMLYSLNERRSRGAIDFEVQLIEGLRIPFSGSEVEVLAPSAYLAGKGPGARDVEGRRITTNTVSAVVRVKTSGRSVLFTGDIDETGLGHLLEAGHDLQADVLVFPHHGGNVSDTATPDRNRRFAERLLTVVDPSIVVFSYARTRYRNPRPEIVEVARADPSRKVMCTQMSQHCMSEPPNEDGHLTDVFADGRRSGHCCAGSIVMSEAGILPSVASHTAFVHRIAPRALCGPRPDAPVAIAASS